MAEQKELEKDSAKSGEQQGKKKAAKASKPSTENSNKKKKKELEKTSEGREPSGENNPEDTFWMPSVGQRWDCDNGGDRWGSGSDSEHESEKVIAMGMFSNSANSTLYLDFH